MSIALFFEPISPAIKSQTETYKTWESSLMLHDETFVDWKKADIAILSIYDPRKENSEEEIKGNNSFADAVRKKLYAFKKSSESFYVCDLGHLKPGPTLQDTYERLQEVCHLLMTEGVTPLVIGNAHHLDIGQFLAYQHHDDPITMLTIDPEFDLDDLGTKDPSKNHIQRILTHKPNFLNHYCHLGYHSYMVEPMALKVYEKLFFESFRLGDIRKSIEEAEPVVRGANILSFDLDSVRAGDHPLNSQANPFGFTGEEACQLAWYAGLSDYISSFGLYGYDPETPGPEADRSAFVLAGMIWYFVEGYYQKVDTLDFESDNYIKYSVQLDKTDEAISFFKSKKSGKWWIELHKKTILPCSYSDYEEAAKGELPERWVHAISRLGVKA